MRFVILATRVVFAFETLRYKGLKENKTFLTSTYFHLAKYLYIHS